MVQDLQDAIELIVDVYEQHVPLQKASIRPIRGRSGSRAFRGPETEAARSQSERAVWVTSRGGWLVREDLVHALGVEEPGAPSVELLWRGVVEVRPTQFGESLLGELEAMLELLEQQATLTLE